MRRAAPLLAVGLVLCACEAVDGARERVAEWIAPDGAGEPVEDSEPDGNEPTAAPERDRAPVSTGPKHVVPLARPPSETSAPAAPEPREGLPPEGAGIEILRVEHRERSGLRPRETDLAVAVHFIPRRTVGARDSIQLKARCVDEDRIVAATSLLIGGDLEDADAGETYHQVSPYLRVALDHEPQRCELAFALWHAAQERAEDLGTFCVTDDAFAPGRCDEPVEPLASSPGPDVAVALVRARTNTGRFNSSPAAMKMERVVQLGRTPRDGARLFSEVACTADGQTRVATSWSQNLTRPAFSYLPGETLIAEDRFFDGDRTGIDQSPEHCELRVIGRDRPGGTVREVLSRHCYRDGKVAPGTCSGRPPRLGTLEVVSADNLDASLSVAFTELLGERNIEVALDATVSHRLTPTKVKIDIDCEVGKGTLRDSTTVYGLLDELEPGETVREWARVADDIAAGRHDCTIEISAKPKHGTAEWIEIGRHCFEGETPKRCRRKRRRKT